MLVKCPPDVIECRNAMKTNGSVAKLRQLQPRLDRMRNKLKISAPNAVLYQAFLDNSEEQIVVEADGFGGATVSIVEGNYPLEFFVKNSKKFRREQAAVNTAMKIVEESIEPSAVLG